MPKKKAKAVTKLEPKAVKAWLKEHDGWKLKGKTIYKTFNLKSFRDSVVFVNRIATLADDRDHHPDIDIRYADVTIGLSTHDAGGITEKDLDLAQAIDFATSAR